VEIELLYAFNDLTPATAVLVADQPIMIGYTDNYTGTRYVPGFPFARIEPDGRVYHRVQSGDTPVGIAVTYGLTMEEFYQRSGLEAGVILQVNQEVLVARTPVPEQIGGSAADEVPTLPPTFTPVPTLTPLPTLTITPMPTVVLLPTITPEPTETIAVLPTPVSTPVLEVVVEGDGERNGLLVGVFAGIIALLLFLGGLLIYMGRRK
jgi:LysM repeat protein